MDEFRVVSRDDWANVSLEDMSLGGPEYSFPNLGNKFREVGEVRLVCGDRVMNITVPIANNAVKVSDNDDYQYILPGYEELV